MENRKVVLEIEDCVDGCKCTAKGVPLKFDDLVAINEFSLDMMHSFVELHKACFEQRYGKEKN